MKIFYMAYSHEEIKDRKDLWYLAGVFERAMFSWRTGGGGHRQCIVAMSSEPKRAKRFFKEIKNFKDFAKYMREIIPEIYIDGYTIWTVRPGYVIGKKGWKIKALERAFHHRISVKKAIYKETVCGQLQGQHPPVEQSYYHKRIDKYGNEGYYWKAD